MARAPCTHWQPAVPVTVPLAVGRLSVANLAVTPAASEVKFSEPWAAVTEPSDGPASPPAWRWQCPGAGTVTLDSTRTRMARRPGRSLA